MKTHPYIYLTFILYIISISLNAQYHNPNKYTYSTTSISQQQYPTTSQYNQNNHFYQQYQPTQVTINNPNFTTIQLQNLSSTPNYNPNSPFHDPTEPQKPSRIQRDETPTDPSVPIPAHHIPLILCSIVWSIIKYIKLLRKKTKFIA